MRYYPLFLSVKNKRCVVIGGGKVAERKIKTLLESGAEAIVVSPVITSKVKKLVERGKVRLIKDSFKSHYLKGAFLVIGATDDKKTNTEISKYCRKNRVLANIVDLPELSSFISPAVLKRKKLIVAISTSALNPALAKKIRQDLERFFKERRYEKLL